MEYSIKPIAHIENDFSCKFGIPRQSGILDTLNSRIIMEPEFRSPEAFRGIEEFSHLWLLWRITLDEYRGFRATVRPPRLGGNKRLGVFATRSPYRPNSIGLSSVRLVGVEIDSGRGPILTVAGADLVSGTPILDIKPYISYTDSHPDARCGFSERVMGHELEVIIPEELRKIIPPDRQEALISILKNDPRPGYHKDPERVYSFEFAGLGISFYVSGGVITVIRIAPLS